MNKDEARQIIIDSLSETVKKNIILKSILKRTEKLTFKVDYDLKKVSFLLISIYGTELFNKTYNAVDKIPDGTGTNIYEFDRNEIKQAIFS